jgi:hypothetical protein
LYVQPSGLSHFSISGISTLLYLGLVSVTSSELVPGLNLLTKSRLKTSAEVFPLPHPQRAAITLCLLAIREMMPCWSSLRVRLVTSAQAKLGDLPSSHTSCLVAEDLSDDHFSALLDITYVIADYIPTIPTILMSYYLTLTVYLIGDLSVRWVSGPSSL